MSQESPWPQRPDLRGRRRPGPTRPPVLYTRGGSAMSWALQHYALIGGIVVFLLLGLAIGGIR
jgi:hypothetical protein